MNFVFTFIADGQRIRVFVSVKNKQRETLRLSLLKNIQTSYCVSVSSQPAYNVILCSTARVCMSHFSVAARSKYHPVKRYPSRVGSSTESNVPCSTRMLDTGVPPMVSNVTTMFASGRYLYHSSSRASPPDGHRQSAVSFCLLQLILTSCQIFAHINGTCNQDNQTLDDIQHIGADGQEIQTDKDDLQQQYTDDNPTDLTGTTHK